MGVCLAVACGTTERDAVGADSSRASGPPPARDTASVTTKPPTTASGEAGPSPKGSVHKVGLHVDTIRIWLDSTSIAAAVHALGSDKITRAGGEGFAMLACFKSTAADKAYLTLEAHNFREESPVVTIILERSLSPASVFTQCAPLAIAASAIRTSIGLHLGMSRAEAEAILGQPRVVQPRFSRYRVDTLAQPAGALASPYSPAVYITLTVDADRVIKMNISQGNELVEDEP
jgi:hypothetical protein